MNSSLTHTTSIRVRYADTDKMGVVYNGNYLTYFEVGRTELLRALGMPYATLEKNGIQLPVLEAHINYKSPAYYDDILNIKTVCAMERGLLLKISYTIKRDEIVLTEGYTVHPFINTNTLKPVRPPAFFIEFLNNTTINDTFHKDIDL